MGKSRITVPRTDRDDLATLSEALARSKEEGTPFQRVFPLRRRAMKVSSGSSSRRPSLGGIRRTGRARRTRVDGCSVRKTCALIAQGAGPDSRAVPWRENRGLGTSGSPHVAKGARLFVEGSRPSIESISGTSIWMNRMWSRFQSGSKNDWRNARPECCRSIPYRESDRCEDCISSNSRGSCR